MFKAFRLVDSIWERMLRLMTHKLHATVTHIFGAMDGAILMVATTQLPMLLPK